MRNFKVLLAEDDSSSAELLIHILERYNFEVTHVTDGMVALVKTRSQIFDLVISDVMMPHLDGISFMEKAHDHLKDTPVIMLTSVSEKEQILRAAHSHVSAYLLKPIDTSALLEKIYKLLNLSPEMIVDKKKYPFSIEMRDISGFEVEMKVHGCPSKKNKDLMYDKLLHFLGGRVAITDLKILLENSFFFEPSAFSILNDFVDRMGKTTKIRAKSVQIISDYLKKNPIDRDIYLSLRQISIN